MTRQGAEKSRNSELLCFYGTSCTRPNCLFKHEVLNKGSSAHVQVEPCRLDLAGLCRATAVTCTKRHLIGDDRIRLIQKMARTPCRFGLECRTKNCLFKHPPKPREESGAGAALAADGSEARAQPPSDPISSRSDYPSPVPQAFRQVRRPSDSSASTSQHSVQPAVVPTASPYQSQHPHWPPQAFGYPMTPYYPHPSYYMGMVPPPVYYYDPSGLYQASPEYLAPPPPPSFADGGGYPRSVSLPGSIGRDEPIGSIDAEPESSISTAGLRRRSSSVESENKDEFPVPHGVGVVAEESEDGELSNFNPPSLSCVPIEGATPALPIDASAKAA